MNSIIDILKSILDAIVSIFNSQTPEQFWAFSTKEYWGLIDFIRDLISSFIN